MLNRVSWPPILQRHRPSVTLGDVVALTSLAGNIYPLRPVAIATRRSEIAVAYAHTLASEAEASNDNIPRVAINLLLTNLQTSYQMTLYHGPQPPQHLTLADAGDNLYLVWNSYGHRAAVLCYQLSSQQPACRFSPTLYLPQLVADGATLYLAGSHAGGLVYLQSDDGGQSWSLSQLLAAVEEPYLLDYAPPRLLASNGRLAMAWGLRPFDTVPLADRLYRRQHRAAPRGGQLLVRWHDGVGWRRAEQVNPASTPAAYPTLAATADRLYVAYAGWSGSTAMSGLYLASRDWRQGGWQTQQIATYATGSTIDGGAARSQLLPLPDGRLLIVALQGGDLYAYTLVGQQLTADRLTHDRRNAAATLLAAPDPTLVWEASDEQGYSNVVAARLMV